MTLTGERMREMPACFDNPNHCNSDNCLMKEVCTSRDHSQPSDEIGYPHEDASRFENLQEEQ